MEALALALEEDYARRANAAMVTLHKHSIRCSCGSKYCAGWKLVPGRRTDVGLAYFKGGPIDGQAYEVATLCTSAARVLPIIEYAWTSEKVTSPTTGAEARVWIHRSLLPAPSGQV